MDKEKMCVWCYRTADRLLLRETDDMLIPACPACGCFALVFGPYLQKEPPLVRPARTSGRFRR